MASAPTAVHGYRTIAFEIAESLGWQVPDWVVVPVSRGDGLFGIWSGFVELAELGCTTAVPRMLAVERFPSLTTALARGLEQPERMHVPRPVAPVSFSDPQGTAMAVHALRCSQGQTVTVDDEELETARSQLASRGVLVELSSAAVLHGAGALAARNRLDADSTVVLLATARSQAPPPGNVATGQHVPGPVDGEALRAALQR